jgi:hypothetical protein
MACPVHATRDLAQGNQKRSQTGNGHCGLPTCPRQRSGPQGKRPFPGEPDGRWGPLHGPVSHWNARPHPRTSGSHGRDPRRRSLGPSRPRADRARSFTRHQRPVHEKAVHRPTPMSGNNLRVVSLPHSPTSNTTVSGRSRGSLGSSSIARGAAGRWRPPPATTRKSYATTRQQPGTCHNHDRGSGPLRCPRRTRSDRDNSLRRYHCSQ